MNTIACTGLDMGMETFGERLSRFREGVGFSQSHVARLVGVTRAAVCDYEHDRRMPGVATLSNLAIALNTTMDALFHGGPTPKPYLPSSGLRTARGEDTWR